jgi:hypothetical protein
MTRNWSPFGVVERWRALSEEEVRLDDWEIGGARMTGHEMIS